jgi:hypothetical protein
MTLPLCCDEFLILRKYGMNDLMIDDSGLNEEPDVVFDEDVTKEAESNILTLEEFRKTLKNGFVPTTNEAKIINLSCEAMGFSPVFAIDAYTGRQNQISMAKIAAEDIGENIRITILKIKKWAARFCDIVFDHIEGILRGANALSKHAEHIQDRAAELNTKYGNKKIEDSQIKNSKLYSFFNNNDGGVYDAETIAKKYGEITKSFNESLTLSAATNGSQYMASQIHKILSRNRSGDFSKEVALSISDETISRMLETNFSAFENKTGNKEGPYICSFPFGNIELRLSATMDDDKFATLSITKVDRSESRQDGLTILTPSEVTLLAKTVEASMHRGIYRDFKKVKSAVYAMKEAISDMTDEMSRSQRETYEGDLPSLHFLKTSSEAIFELVKLVYSLNGNAARNILRYCEYSLKFYSAELAK